MTLEEYINNPVGKNNAILTVGAREAIRADYTHRFDNILLRENGKITYYLYEDKKQNAYYILVKVPSEVVDNFYYDVVFKFTAKASITDLGRNLFKYDIQFFSNDPSFVFTYAHAFIKHELFIKELLPRMSKQAIKQNPDIKNPNNETGYVKAIYFAYLFMKERGLFNVNAFKGSEPYTKQSLISKIEPADDKVKARQEEGKKYSSRKKIVVDKGTADKIKRMGVDDKAMERLVVTTNKTTAVKKTKAANKTTKVIKAKKKK